MTKLPKVCLMSHSQHGELWLIHTVHGIIVRVKSEPLQVAQLDFQQSFIDIGSGEIADAYADFYAFCEEELNMQSPES